MDSLLSQRQRKLTCLRRQCQAPCSTWSTRAKRAGIVCESVWGRPGAAAVHRNPESLAYPRTKQNLVVSGRRNGENQTLQVADLSLTLRPDPIDELEDGRRSVIDYKTRAPSKTNWLGDRPQRQLPLTACDSTISGIAFAELSTADSPKFVALGEDLGFARRRQID